MATNSTLTLSFLLCIILLNLLQLTTSDDTCPYPCYPPPIGTTTGTPPSPPTPPSETGVSYPPPDGYTTPPAGNLPIYPPPPPPPVGGSSSLFGPPPPDAILPYFPYYYRKPLLGSDGSSLATSLPGFILTVIPAVASFVFCFL